jgi:putative transposase
MAIARRGECSGVIFHSDRGSQYASHDFRQLLAAHNMIASMLAKGDCWDNAPVESFFASLKKETFLNGSMSGWQVKNEVFEYIEVFYDRQSIHSTLNGMSPEKYEQIYFKPDTLCA